MPDYGEDLPIAGSEADQDLRPEFTLEELEAEIWADLDAVYDYPEREKGDLDAGQVAKKYKTSTNTAWRRMEKIAARGEHVIITVLDRTSHTGVRKVLRKVK